MITRQQIIITFPNRELNRTNTTWPNVRILRSSVVDRQGNRVDFGTGNTLPRVVRLHRIEGIIGPDDGIEKIMFFHSDRFVKFNAFPLCPPLIVA